MRGLSALGFGASCAPIGALGAAAVAPPPPEGTALPAPVLLLKPGTAITDYPPQVGFKRPIDWIDGDVAVMQRSQDPAFATGVSEATRAMVAATTTYDFGLSSIASGSGAWYFRMAAWRGNRPGALSWSNIVGMGDAVPPVITMPANLSTQDGAPMLVNLSANEPVIWSLGGRDVSRLEIVNNAQLRLSGNAVADYVNWSSYVFTLIARDYVGNQSSKAMKIDVSSNYVIWDAQNRNSRIALSNGKLTVTGTAESGYQGVRATGQDNRFEILLDGLDALNSVYVGLASAAQNFTTRPGRDTEDAVTMAVGPWGFEIWSKGSIAASGYYSWGFANGTTRVRVERNPATGVISFFVAPNGSTFIQFDGSWNVAATLDQYYPFVMLEGATPVTADFGLIS